MEIKVNPIKGDQTDETRKEYIKEKGLINKYKLDFTKKEEELNNKNAELKKLMILNDIKDKDSQLLKQTIKEQDTLMSTMKEEIEKHNKRIEEMSLEIIEHTNTITQLKEELNNKKVYQTNEETIEVNDYTQRSKEVITKSIFPTATNDVIIRKKKFGNDELSSQLDSTLVIEGISSNDKEIVKMLQTQIIKAKNENEELVIDKKKKTEEITMLQFHYQSMIQKLEEQIKLIKRKNKKLLEKNNRNKTEYTYFNREKTELEEVILKQEEKITESNYNLKKLLHTITKQNKEIEESRRYNSNLLEVINNLQQTNQKLKFKKDYDFRKQLSYFKIHDIQIKKGKFGKINLSPIVTHHISRRINSKPEIEHEKQLSSSVGNLIPMKIDNAQKNRIESTPFKVPSFQFDSKRIRMYISNSINFVQEREKVEEFKKLMNNLAEEVKNY